MTVCVRRTTRVHLLTYSRPRLVLARRPKPSRPLPVRSFLACSHTVNSAISRHNHTKLTEHYTHQSSDRHQVSEASEWQVDTRHQHRQQNENQAQLPRLHPHPACASHPTPIHKNLAPTDHYSRGDLFQISTPRRGRDESVVRGDAAAGGRSASVCSLGIEVAQVDSASSSSWSNKSKAKRFLVGMLPSFAIFLLHH